MKDPYEIIGFLAFFIVKIFSSKSAIHDHVFTYIAYVETVLFLYSMYIHSTYTENEIP